MKLRRALCAFVVALTPASALAVSVPFGPEFLVNTYTLGNEFDPDVAAATAGGFMVVWLRNGDGSQSGVFGRVYDAAGNAIGDEFQVNTYTPGPQQSPSIAADAHGNFVVAWTSEQDGDDFGVFGQLFDGSGNKMGTEFQVNSFTPYAQGYYGISVSSEPSGDFVVAWASYYQDGYGWGVFGQRFDSSGGRSGTEFQVNTYTPGDQGKGDNYSGIVTARSASGDFVVAWASYYQDGYANGVFARHFDGGGVPTTPTDFQVTTYTAGDEGTRGFVGAAAAAGPGTFVVAWTTYYQDGDYFGVFGRRLDSTGVPVGGEFQVNTYTVSGQGSAGPALAADVGGEVFVVWSSGAGFGQDGLGFGVFGQRYASDGTPIAGEFQVNTFTASSQWLPSVASDWGGCSVVVWQSSQPSTPFACTMDTQCPKWPLEECIGGMCSAVGQQDGFEGGIFGQRYCRARPLDHYKCYKVKDRKTPKFLKRDVSLVDQFVSETATVIKPFLVCNPVDKNDEGINDPSLHQCCYKIKAQRLKPRPELLIASQFQRSRVSAIKGRLLCAPCTKRVLP